VRLHYLFAVIALLAFIVVGGLLDRAPDNAARSPSALAAGRG